MNNMASGYPADKSRKCPECKHWWFDRMRHGCRLNDDRQTNTTAQLGYNQWAAGPCNDFKTLIMKS